MPKGVKIERDHVGTGRIARRGDVVAVNLRFFLNRGDEVTAEYPDSPRTVIDLGKRETIAGVRYGIEGMREGGSRTFVVSPHLAYGEDGMGEWIPPNAILRCEVELLEVHDAGYSDPVERGSASWISVFIPGIAAESRPRVQMSLSSSGPSGAMITRARPDGSWRKAPTVCVSCDFEAAEFSNLLDEATTLPDLFPDESLANDLLWADASETANSVTRDQATDTPCISISVALPGKHPVHYSVKQDSAAWTGSILRSFIVRCLSDQLLPNEVP